MTISKKHITLVEIQKRVSKLEDLKGFSDHTLIQISLLIGEEVGELFKAIRDVEHLKIDSASRVNSVSEELSDILILLCSVANRIGIDLEKAFLDKEKVNIEREWK